MPGFFGSLVKEMPRESPRLAPREGVSRRSAPLAPLDLDSLVTAPSVPGKEEPEESLEEKYFSGRFPTNPLDPQTRQRVRVDTTTPAYARAWAAWMERRRQRPGL